MTRYPTNRVTGDPSRPSPLFGHGPDFGYFYYGSIWYGDELWNGGQHKDYNNDGIFDDYDGLQWDEEANNGNGFREWEPFTHPEFGEVEIGGFHPKFFAQNGPPHQLEKWASRQALFNLAMAKDLPLLNLDDVTVTEKSKTNDETVYSIKVTWTNVGNLPVALKQAQLVKIVREDRAQLEFEEELIKGKDAKVKILTPSTYDKTIRAGYTEPGETKETEFEVRVLGKDGGKVKVLSTRGGYLEALITLGKIKKE